jgi:uncharacterized DUF497 family protein
LFVLRLRQFERSFAIRQEQDELKAERNKRKHDVTFVDAMGCFYDPHQIAFYAPDHSEDEDREILIAHSRESRLLVVIYTLRGDTIRIISARRATHREAEDYAQGI